MKPDLKKYGRRLLVGVGAAWRRFPIETLLMAGVTAAWIADYEYDLKWSYGARVVVTAWYALVVLAVNLALRGTRLRRLYYASWLPLAALVAWPGLEAWLETPQAAVTFGLLAPLALLVARRRIDNRRFAAESFALVGAAGEALLFANVALLFFEAILWSTAYIFGFDDARWVAHLAVHAVIVAEACIAPLVALGLVDRRIDADAGGLSRRLVDWIVTPALIVYTAIVYLYMAKIAVTWSLPRGGVAYMVCIFAVVTLLVRLLGEGFAERRAAWFYDRFSLVMLPAAVLFWLGAARRIGDYGLTEARVYLLLCGAVLTAAVALFFARRTGRYLYLAAFVFALFAASAYVPGCSPARIGLDAQRGRFERLARALGRLDDAGQLVPSAIPLADSIRRDEYRELFAAMEYVERRDSTFMPSLGVVGTSAWRLRQDLPFELEPDYDAADEAVDTLDWVFLYLPSNVRVESDPHYPRLYANIEHYAQYEGVRWTSDRLTVRMADRSLTVSADSLVRTQLDRAGVTWDELTASTDSVTLVRMLDYRGETVRVLFRRLDVDRTPAGCYMLDAVEVALVMTR